MTIDRMIRRGVFPILSERPLDESETAEPATAKVYVVEVGAYSDRYIDAIFTTRELAEAFVEDRKRRAFERQGIKAHRVITGWSYEVPPIAVEGPKTFSWSDGKLLIDDQVVAEGTPSYEDRPAETYEQFLKRHTWNEFGDVEEYDLWDMIPVVRDS